MNFLKICAFIRIYNKYCISSGYFSQWTAINGKSWGDIDFTFSAILQALVHVSLQRPFEQSGKASSIY